jgi:hypothetical protein
MILHEWQRLVLGTANNPARILDSYMDEEVTRVFAALRDLPDFSGIDVTDINACGTDGDNALHYVVHGGDISAAKALIDAGIDVNKAGDLGYSPLHVACIKGNLDMVKLLVEKGADLFALSEGYPPFTNARSGGYDHICDFLTPLMEQMGSRDRKIWLKSRIAQLRREIADLEARLDASDEPT